MLTKQDFIVTPPTVEVSLSVEPVINILCSMMLLNLTQERSGLGKWIEETAQKLPAEILHRNQVLSPFYSILCPKTYFADFEAYLTDFETQNPDSFPDLYLNTLREHYPNNAFPENLLKDKQVFLDTAKSLLLNKGGNLEEYDEQLHIETFDYLQEPAKMQKMLADHLRYMWENGLNTEWQRVLPLLQEAVTSFQQLDLSDLTALEAIRAITGRDLSSIWDGLDDSHKFVFVPSAHIGPYISNFMDFEANISYMVFGARTPEGISGVSTALTRSDLLVQLNALADETRLTILELLNQYRELCAQDIISMLNLSQSSASRHLRQLTASGYLIERRRDVNKCYSLNRGRIQETALALNMFFGAR